MSRLGTLNFGPVKVFAAKEVSMGLKIEGVTHWSIPVNDIAESEKFYGDLLGLKPLGRLGNAVMSCFNVGDHNILLCERERPANTSEVEQRVHHSFTMLAATDSSCAIRAGNKECQSLRSRKSCAREIPGLSRRSLRFSVHLAAI